MTPLLETSRRGPVTLLRLSRAANRNALNAEMIAGLTTPAAGIQHSHAWCRAFEPIEYGPVPVLAVPHGAVLGGGLEHGAGEPTKPAHGAVTPCESWESWCRFFFPLTPGKNEATPTFPNFPFPNFPIFRRPDRSRRPAKEIGAGRFRSPSLSPCL